MAKKSISQFTSATTVNSGDLLMISQLSGNAYVTRSLSAGNFATKDYLSAQISATVGNINSILEAINVGNAQIDSMIDQLNGTGI